MSSGGDRDLTKFINPNLTWKTVKKGSRSESRGVRRQAERNIKVDGELGSNVSNNERDSSIIESEKVGAAFSGEHFTEKIKTIPLKKRRLNYPSPLPPPKTPSLNQEGSLSPHPNTSSSDHEQQIVISKCASGQPSSNSCAEKCANSHRNKLGIDGGVRSKSSDPTTKEFCGGENLSSMALLATVACSGSNKDADRVDSSRAEKHATTEANDLLTAGMKGTVTSPESEGSSVPGNALPVVQSLHCGNEHDSGEKSSAPLKKAKFHWDLNETMDEWEEPYFNLPQTSPRNCAEGVVDDGLHCQNLKLEDCRRTEFDNTGCERKRVASDTEISANKSTVIDFFVPHVSSISSLVGQDDVIGDSRQKDVDQCYPDTTTNDLSEAADSEKNVDMFHGMLVTEEAEQDGLHFQKSCKCLDDYKFASEDPQSDVCGLEVFQDKQWHLADGNSMITVQEGYESPYEDGELREAVVHAWDEKEVEKRENECIDFESKNEYKTNSLSEKFVPGHGNSQTTLETSLLVERNVDAVPVNLNTSGGQSQEHSNNANSEGKETVSKNGHDETRTFGGNMFPAKGYLSFGGLRRSDTVDMKRSRSGDAGATYFQTEREFGSEEARGRERLPFQGHSRNEVDFRWADSGERTWEWRNRYPNSKPKNVIGDSDGRPSGFNIPDRSQSRSYDPRGMYGPPNRRQSSTERNDSYDFRGERRTMQGFSRERSRGRSVFSPEAYRRGPGEKYHERGSYYIERKERGFTPSSGRDSEIMRPHRRSRSRSRSLSPIAWNMHKIKRSTRQRSPDFRTEVRVPGERFPSQKSSDSGDFERRLVSPPRGRRWSPQRNSRCFDDRKSMDRPYSDRRSSPPVRMFKPNPRYDSYGHAERSNSSGDYFRPATRPGRFSQMPGFGQGPRNYDGSSDDGKKPDEGHETTKRMGRDNTGPGGPERFGHDAANCIEPRDARDANGSVSRRSTPSNINEERSSPVIHQEKLTNTDVSSPGEQDFDMKLTNTDASSPGRQDFDVKLSNIDASSPGKQDFDVKLTNTDASSPGKQDFDVKLTNTDASSHGKQDFDVKLTTTDASSPGKQDFDMKLTNTDASSHVKQDFDVMLTNTDASSPGKQDFDVKLTNTDASSPAEQDFDVKLTNTDASSPREQYVNVNASTKED